MTEIKEQKDERGVLLVIDDEVEVTKAVKRHFRKQYEVYTAASGEEGLKIMEEVMVHVVISDQRMPGLNGMEILRKIRKQHPNVVRMILTGYSDLKAVIDAINEGHVYRYITKPWEPVELDSIVRDSFARYRLQAENERLMRDLKNANEELEMRVAVRTSELLEARKEAESRAAEYRSIFEHSPLGIFHFDHLGRVTNCNPKLVEILGVEKEDLLGFDLLKEVKDPLITRAIETCIMGEPAVFEGESRALRGGARLFLKIDFNPVPNDEKKRFGGIGILEEITEKKRMQEDLIQMQKLESLGVLAGGIAHDFNNLLSVILGNISLVREKVGRDAFFQPMLKDAETDCVKAAQLTKRFLAFSAGGAPVTERVDVQALVEDAVKLALSGSPIQADVILPDERLFVKADPRQIVQALINIIENAREAMGEGGRISISAGKETAMNNAAGTPPHSLEGEVVWIRIKDQGAGISEKDLPRVFEPYYSTKVRGIQKGMGLGLATAYTIIRNHHGHLAIESEMGEGTTVTIYLPFAAGESAEKKSAQGKSSQAIRRVLLMDDEESLRSLAGKMLERLGYEATAVKDGAEAVAAYKKQMDLGKPFDAVILDLTIKGGMGGSEAVRHLLTIDPEVKAIVSSGYFNDPIMTKFREYGFKATMAKPYQKETMMQVLNKVI